MEKIIGHSTIICLFCGEEIKSYWEDCDTVYECGCEDAVKNRLIDDQIYVLNQTRPAKKYTISERRVLYTKETN